MKKPQKASYYLGLVLKFGADAIKFAYYTYKLWDEAANYAKPVRTQVSVAEGDASLRSNA